MTGVGGRAAESGRAGRSARHAYIGARRRAGRRRVEVLVWLSVAAGALGGAGVQPPLADRSLLLAVAAVAVVVALARRPQRDPERWSRGAAGEEATAALLARLGTRRWAVLHDRRLPGSTANVDHLVIGPTGVWVLDSKAYRSRVRAGWRRVRVGGHRLDTGPAAWEASVVADRLGVAVRPLVVVHARGLPRRGRRCDGVRVLPADRAVRHLRRTRTGTRLGRDDVAALAARAAEVLPEA